MNYNDLPKHRKDMYEHFGNEYGFTGEEAYIIFKNSDYSNKKKTTLDDVEKSLIKENISRKNNLNAFDGFEDNTQETIEKRTKERINELNSENEKYDKIVDDVLIKGKITAIVNDKRVTMTQFIKNEKAKIIDNMITNVLTNMKEYEENLVKISTNTSASPLCIKRQGRVYWVEVPQGNYRELEPEMWRSGGGLFHPNCRHNMSVYFEGESSPPPSPQPSQKDLADEYKKRQEQNYINRNKKKWYDYKENARNTGNSNQDYYTKKWKEWTARAK